MIKNKSVLIEYISNGKEKIFEFPFKIFSKDEIKIYINNQEITVNFNIEIDEKEGGKIIFPIAPVSNSTIKIIRDLNFQRLTDFQSGGDFKASDVNNEFDYQVSCMQQLRYDTDKSLKVCVSQDINTFLPKPKAGHFIVWNKDENGFKLENAELIQEASNSAQDAVELCKDILDAITDALSLSYEAGLAGKVNKISQFLQEKYPDDFEDLGYANEESVSTQDFGTL